MSSQVLYEPAYYCLVFHGICYRISVKFSFLHQGSYKHLRLLLSADLRCGLQPITRVQASIQQLMLKIPCTTLEVAERNLVKFSALVTSA